jgi:hypothetical protein
VLPLEDVKGGRTARVLRACVPIAVGHAASIALVAGAVVFGMPMDRAMLQAVAGGLLLIAVAVVLWRRAAPRVRAPAEGAALALASCMVSTAHGAGLMLVPALVPLCGPGAAAREIGASGPLTLAIAAVGVHAAAMLAVAGLAATSACVVVAVARVMRLGPPRGARLQRRVGYPMLSIAGSSAMPSRQCHR